MCCTFPNLDDTATLTVEGLSVQAENRAYHEYYTRKRNPLSYAPHAHADTLKDSRKTPASAIGYPSARRVMPEALLRLAGGAAIPG